MRILSFSVLACSALVFAGCGGSNATVANPGPCTPPGGTTTVLVYPAPGSTSIPDNLGLVVLASSTALPVSYQAYLVNNTTQNALTFNTLGVAPTTIPAPNTVPAFANPAYQSSGNPGTSFVPGSTITVYLNNTASNCSPTLSLGSFVVQ